MADKDVPGTVTALSSADSLAGGRVIATRVAGPRAMAPNELAAIWRRDAASTARISGRLSLSRAGHK